MMKRSLIILLVALLAVSDAYKYITSIDVDGPSGQIYVGENQDQSSVLYELDNGKVKQNAVHNLPGTSLDSGSFFIGKRSNGRVLYAVTEDTTGAADLSFFRVPIGNQVTLPSQQTSQIGTKALSLAPTYNVQDNRAILAVSRNLTLVNLQNLNVLDSILYYTSSRSFGHNLVYNPQNNHLLSFYTIDEIGAPYGLNVDEFDLTTGKFVQVATTYKCECETNPESSPFYDTVLVDGNCELDTTVSPSRIWCVDSDNSAFFNFKANDLSVFTKFTTSSTFSTVAFDFANQVAYAIYDSAGAGFQVHKINLKTEGVEKSFTTAGIAIDATTFAVDPEEPHLYISVANTDDSQPTQIVYVNTDNLSSFGLVTLDSSSLTSN